MRPRVGGELAREGSVRFRSVAVGVLVVLDLDSIALA
jgi:hypothetical protein